MTVVEFIEYLKQFPQEAEVYVGVAQYSFCGSDGLEKVDHELFTGEKGVEFEDYSQYEFVKPNHPYFGKTVVFLGEAN